MTQQSLVFGGIVQVIYYESWGTKHETFEKASFLFRLKF